MQQICACFEFYVFRYCSSCSKKTQEKVQPKVKTIQADSNHKKGKVEFLAENKNSVFKRNEKSTNSSHNKNSSGSGMAHLAASFQGNFDSVYFS